MVHDFIGWLILVWILFFVTYSHEHQVTNCLDLRENCRKSLACRSKLKKLSDCGSSLSGCLPNNTIACSITLDGLRQSLNSTCFCNVDEGKFDECIKFQTKIWNNPCETAVVEEIQQVNLNRTRQFLRNARSPNSERIQRWRNELSQELKPDSATLSSTTCTNALFELCLKHISCRELWKLFRQECAIDAQNKCSMTNKENCWQSFEGISWTGLGNCTCQTNNSDCHWIRLQTNYNKCIYEITNSGDFVNTVSVKVPLAIASHTASTTPIVPYWATVTPSNTQYPNSQTYSYQPQSTSLWTTSIPSTISTPLKPLTPLTHLTRPPNLQHEEYQREYARIENERREHEKRLKEYEEQRRRWYEQNSQQNQQNQHYTVHTSTVPTPVTTSTSTQKPYIRATYSSTPQVAVSQNSTKAYRLNEAYYRKNVTQSTPSTITQMPTTTPTTRPKTTRRPKTTSTTSTTSTTTPLPTTIASEMPITEKPAQDVNEARLPMQYLKQKPSSTTTPEPISTSNEAKESTSLNAVNYNEKASSEIEISSNVDEEKLKILLLEPRTRGDSVEELKGFEGVLVNKWELPTKQSDSAKSTCAKAHENCEKDETCRWHLSELQMKCRMVDDCQRSQCASSMRRFARYVNKNLLESMFFCQCSFSDSTCKYQQSFMYPRCLYDTVRTKPSWSCTQVVKLCSHDSYCSRTLTSLQHSCPLSDGVAGGCVAKDLGQCRLALIGVRGTDLESPCYCNKGDDKCAEHQNMVLPNNPCVEDAMVDFISSGSIPTANDRKLPKSRHHPQNSSRRAQKKLKSRGEESKFKLKPTTSTTTTSTTPEPTQPEDENEIMEETSSETNGESRDLLSEESEVNEEGDKDATNEKGDSTNEKEDSSQASTNETIADSLNISKVPVIKSSMPSKGIKISKTSGGTTAKVISGQKLVTQTPPPKEGNLGGCSTRNIEGDWVVHYKNSVFRQYDDLSGRCSSYCECSENEKTKCAALTCMPEGSCETPNTKIEFGQRLYIEGKGACLCHSGQFICESSDEIIELDPGIYISLGFSRDELIMIKSKVPKAALEKCGLVSPDISVQNDIAGRLQFALERLLPKNMTCRIALIERYSRDSVMLLQIQWYGIDRWSNTSKGAAWHVGKLEKICAPYVKALEYQFLLERAARYQLVLSTVKQLRVYDLLDGLPPITSSSLTHCPIPSLILSLLLIATIKLRILSTTTSICIRVP